MVRIFVIFLSLQKLRKIYETKSGEPEPRAGNILEFKKFCKRENFRKVLVAIMAEGNELQALDKITTEVDEAQIKVILATQCIKGRPNTYLLIQPF